MSMKIVSFNVNGIRAIVKKTFQEDIQKLDADIICLQETKATAEQVKDTLKNLNYSIYANEAVKKGYSGTAILTKHRPESVNYKIGISDHDQEGRIVHLTFENFHLVNVYVPNSGSELLRLEYRTQWDKDFLLFLKQLEKSKPVVVCGDFNVAHKDIDLARPKQNYNKSAGYMQEEINGMDAYTKLGFIDSYRKLNEKTPKYTWWSYRAGARSKNIGWRIDYFLVSQDLENKIINAEIHNEILGSDHCPVSLTI